MNAPLHLAQHASAPAAVLYLTTSTGAGQVVDLPSLSLAQVEQLLGGPLEVLHLDAQACLLTNARANALHLDKNLPASHRWFARHQECGAGADFIRGVVIACQASQVAHLNPLHVEPMATLTLSPRERADRAWAKRQAVAADQEHAQAQLACSLENPGSCAMCGA